MTQRIFKRAFQLILTRPSGFFTQGGNQVTITNQRIQFVVEKNLGKDPNNCDIVINNLSESSRNDFQKKPLHVRLDAGYDEAPKLLFMGDMRWSESVKDGTEWETKLQVGDGERSYRFARVARSFKGGVTIKTALQELAKSMELKLPKNVLSDKALNTQFVSGLVLQGRSAKEFDKILSPIGYDWSIQNGQLQILKPNEVKEGIAYKFNQDTGMIGSPAYGTPPDKGKPPVLKATSLLYPQLIPGAKILISSVRINGLFKLQRVLHSGDTHGEDWMTEVEAVPV